MRSKRALVPEQHRRKPQTNSNNNPKVSLNQTQQHKKNPQNHNQKKREEK